MADKPETARVDDDRLELDGFIPYRLSVMQQEVSRAIAATYAEKHGLMRHDWRVMAALGDDSRYPPTRSASAPTWTRSRSAAQSPG